MADPKVTARKYYDKCMEVLELGKQRDALQMQITEMQRQCEPLTHALKDTVGANIRRRHINIQGTGWMVIVTYVGPDTKDNKVEIVEVEYAQPD